MQRILKESIDLFNQHNLIKFGMFFLQIFNRAEQGDLFGASAFSREEGFFQEGIQDLKPATTCKIFKIVLHLVHELTNGPYVATVVDCSE